MSNKERVQFSRAEAKDKPRQLARALSAVKVGEAVVENTPGKKNVLYTQRGEVITDPKILKAMKAGVVSIYKDMKVLNPERAEKIVKKYSAVKVVFQG